MRIPCVNCLVLPVCQNKNPKELWVDCELMDVYLTTNGNTYEEYYQLLLDIQYFMRGRSELSM
jgi:hypothetical protein